MHHRALALALCLATPALAQDRAPARDLPVLKEVERLRGEVSKLRGIEWQAPVRVGVKSPDQIRAMLMESLEEEAPPEEMLKQEKVLKVLGLIPRDYDLRARTIDFLAEHIAGYYDHEEKELFVVDSSAGGGQKVPDMAKGMMEEVAMAHELHHALQDQNYDLSRWFELLGGDDDRTQGYKSLVEGEAQIVGMRFMFKKMGREDMDIVQFNRMQDMAMRFSPEGAEMRKIPPYILENMMFPYTQGAEFVQALQRKRGWTGIGPAYADPPMSTEQVLHPEKYLGDVRDEPVDVLLPSGLKGALGKKTKELCDNVLGEFNVSLVLRALGVEKARAEKAAAGWDGDHFAGFETEDGRSVVVWLSTWDSEAEAGEFEGVYRKALKNGEHLERRGTEVLLVAGASADERAKLVRRAFQAVKVDCRFTTLPGLTARPPLEDFTGEPGAAQSPGAAAPGAAATTSPALGGLHRADTLGVTLAPPAGLAVAPEPVQQLASMGSLYLEGAGGRARVLRLPVPGPAATEQLVALVKQEAKDVTISAPVQGTTLGRPSWTYVITGTLPREAVRSTTRVTVLDLGPDALAFGVSVPEGAGSADALQAQLLAGLWIDGTATAAARRTTLGDKVKVSLEEPEGFLTRAGQGPILGTLERQDGAKVQVVAVPTADGVEDGARALEAQLPLLLSDYRRVAGGVVVRGDQKVHELEFEAAGRRTRQLTFVRDGQRVSVACSAPADRFEACLPAFGRALASARLEAAPAAPAPERKAY